MEKQPKRVQFKDGFYARPAELSLSLFEDEEEKEEAPVVLPKIEKDERWASELKKIANFPSLRTEVLERRYQLIIQGRSTLKYKGILYTEAQIEKKRIECEESKHFLLMFPFFKDLEFSRP